MANPLRRVMASSQISQWFGPSTIYIPSHASERFLAEFLVVGGGGGGGYSTSGGGGGGGGANVQNGGAGGSGFVVLRFLSSYSLSVGGGLTSSNSTAGGFKIYQFTAGTGTVTFS